MEKIKIKIEKVEQKIKKKEDAIAKEELILEERNVKLKKLKKELEQLFIEKDNIFSEEFLKIMYKSNFNSDEDKIEFIKKLNAKIVDEPTKESGHTHQAEPEFSFSDGKDKNGFNLGNNSN